MDATQTQALYAELVKDLSHSLSLWIESQRDLGAACAPPDDPLWPASDTELSARAESVSAPNAPDTQRISAPAHSQKQPSDDASKHRCSCTFSAFNSLRNENKQSVPETLEERRIALSLLNAHMSACHKCMLGGKPRGILTGRGPLDPLMMFVAAGANPAEIDSDRFLCGEAADLLEKMVGAMHSAVSDKIDCEHIYMTNIIKCACLAPKNKRDDIARCCIRWLREEIAIVRPRIIVVWGEFAYHAMFGGNASISQVRGQWKSFENVPVIATHHPLEIIHNPELKKRVWPDLQKAGYALKL